MRADLAALTPEAVATLTNLGLVKRAQREITRGRAPTLSEGDDGVVSGSFDDGVVTQLAPGVPLREARCSCGALGACRHAVAVALSYASWLEAHEDLPAEREAWSPGEIGDDALLEFLGKRVLARARTLVERGCDVEVRQALDDGVARRPPTARLPTCTVQFLVPRDLAYARCECTAGLGCEHVAVAVWAFRRGPDGVPVAQVHLAPERAIATRPLSQARQLFREVLLEGVPHLTKAIATKIQMARTAVDAAHMTWPGTLVDDLEELVGAYESRSARYRAADVADLVAEMAARSRAVAGEGRLPRRFVLGVGEARETALGHTRLVALGARLDGSGREREAEVYLAEPDSGVVLVLRKSWTFGEDEEVQDGPRLAERTLVTGARLRVAAAGQIVTKAAKRRANRLLRLGAVRRDKITVSPQTGEWNELPRELVLTDLVRYAALLAEQPPRWLRPRVLAEAVRVVPIDSVEEVFYTPGAQAVGAVVRDPAGNELLILRRHRAVVPHALGILAAALTDAEHPPRYVSGHLSLRAAGFEIDPLAVVSDRVHVLDIATHAPPLDLPLAELPSPDTPIEDALQAARSCLDDVPHVGLLRLGPAWRDAAGRARERLESVGLRQAAGSLGILIETLGGAAQAPGPGSPGAQRAAAAWEEAAIRIELTRTRSARWARETMSDAAMGSSEDALALGEEVRDQKDSGDWHGSRR